MMGPSRVLVVDDDTETVALLQEILVKEGYEVSTADDAAAALREAARQEPDVVITDIQMPGMDGVALLAELRLRFPKTLVILATAFG